MIIRNRSVWPTLFLLNVFTLKGTHFYIFIIYAYYQAPRKTCANNSFDRGPNQIYSIYKRVHAIENVISANISYVYATLLINICDNSDQTCFCHSIHKHSQGPSRSVKGIRSQKLNFICRRKGLERLTFCNTFYENQWIGFVVWQFVYFAMSDYGGRHFVSLVT